MNRKLTLNIDDSIISFAHDYSKKTKQSISSIVEKYFIELKANSVQEFEASETNSLYGILDDISIPDKKELQARFNEKNID